MHLFNDESSQRHFFYNQWHKIVSHSCRTNIWQEVIFGLFDLPALLYASFELCRVHYDDVIMSAIASQITSLTIVYSTVYSGADQRKHQSSASLAFVWGSHRDRWIPRTKCKLRVKCFHLMTSSWIDGEMWWQWAKINSGSAMKSRQSSLIISSAQEIANEK